MDAQTVTAFVQYGALGAMCAFLGGILIWIVKKMFSVIENNTKAMTELKGVIDKCQIVHRYAGS